MAKETAGREATPADAPFEGSAKARAMIERLDRFVRDELAPLESARDVTPEGGGERALYEQVWRRANALGFYGMTLPESMGGAGFNLLDQALVKEFVYATGSALAPHILGDLTGPPRVVGLIDKVTPDQMERFIWPVVRADKAMCLAITEADAGSDAGALQTKAKPEGDGFVLDGRKRFISGSPFADFAVVLTSTSADPAERQITAFFVEADRPGYRVEGGYKTMAGQSHTADIVLESCRIPASNQIGAAGRGLALALGRVTQTRLLLCPTMTGLATAALNDSLAHAAKRRQFGQSIGDFQAIQHMLADMAIDLAAARALMLSVARTLDGGGDGRAVAAMAKLFCSEAAFRVADRAVQIHGGEGIIQGGRVEWIFRMLRMYRVLAGTSEVQRNTIAKDLLSRKGV